MIETLEHWQELAGGVIGGLMGFVGAWVVASGASARERRSAARQLTIGIGLWENVYGRIEKFRVSGVRSPGVSDGSLIADQLAIFKQNLSPLFEQQVMQVSHLGGGQLAGLLTAFLTVFRRMESYAEAVATSNRSSTEKILNPYQPLTNRNDEDILAGDFQRAHKFAAPATYLLLPECEWWWRRWTMRRDRALCPTDEDIKMQAAIRSFEPSP
jgi:hypothetical protein